MNYGATLTYDNGAESVLFTSSREDQYISDFWLDDAPNLSGVEIDVSESQTAGQIGSSVNSQAVKSKTLIFTGTIHRNTAPARAKLIRTISPQTLARLTYAYQGQRWYLEGVPSQTPIIAAGEVIQPFQFQIKCAFPYWRDANEVQTSIAGLNKNFMFPFNTGGNWYISTFSDSFYTVINNRGNVAIGVTIKIDTVGDVSNPNILNMKTEQKIELNRNFVAGEYADIVTEYGKRAVVLSDVNGVKSNGFKYLTGDSDITMTLEPGENIFRFDADAGRELARVSVVAPQMGVLSGV